MARYLFWLALLMPLCAGADMLRDPTVPLNFQAGALISESVQQKGEWDLEAIYITSRPYAVINGKALHVGEQLNGYTVSKIARGNVELDNGTEKLNLTLYKNGAVLK
ncbi:MAG: hypothetical protein ACI4VX_01945 [Succinivibrionaceae bacterium]